MLRVLFLFRRTKDSFKVHYFYHICMFIESWNHVEPGKNVFVVPQLSVGSTILWFGGSVFRAFESNGIFT